MKKVVRSKVWVWGTGRDKAEGEIRDKVGIEIRSG